jgi:thiaminase
MIKESDYLKLDLTYVKTMMKIHLQGMLKQEETQVVELDKERMQHENKVQVEFEKKTMQCEKVQGELKNERAQHKKERMQHEKVQV